MSKTTFAELGLFLALPLGLVGCFGLFGLMAGQISWFFGGMVLILISLQLANLCNWIIRTESYPEHAITSEWDDVLADYTYSYEYYGRTHTTGDKKWATKLAKHYSIAIDHPNKPTYKEEE